MQEIEVLFLAREDSPGVGNGNQLQYSCLGNPMDRGAWQATIHGAAKELGKLNNSTTTATTTNSEPYVLIVIHSVQPLSPVCNTLAYVK